MHIDEINFDYQTDEYAFALAEAQNSGAAFEEWMAAEAVAAEQEARQMWADDRLDDDPDADVSEDAWLTHLDSLLPDYA